MMQPTKWWRVWCPDNGYLWCETSDESEARKALTTAPKGAVLQRYYEPAMTGEWVSEE